MGQIKTSVHGWDRLTVSFGLVAGSVELSIAPNHFTPCQELSVVC